MTTIELKQKIFAEHIVAKEGRAELAAAMETSLRDRIDRKSMLLRVLAPHVANVCTHERERFNQDTHAFKWVHTLPFYKLQPLVDSPGGFQFIEEMQQSMADNTVAWHNRMLLSTLADDLLPVEDMPQPYPDGKVLMDPVSYTWFRTEMSHDSWDSACTTGMLRNDLLGSWGGSVVYTSRSCPVGVILFCPSPDVLGTVSTVDTLSACDDPRAREIKFASHSYALPRLHENHPPVYAWAPPLDE